jgi:NAD(P)H-flavin reductase
VEGMENFSPTDPMIPRSYRVKRKIRESHDTFTLDLQPDNLEEKTNFAPGQFNMLYTFGVGEVPISISGPMKESGHILHTIRGVGNVTQALNNLKIGQKVGLRGPFGNAWPIEEAKGKDVIIMAGGIGLAPLRPAVYSLFSQRQQYGDIALLYGSRKQEDLLFHKEFETWRGKYGIQVKVTVDTGDRSWKGNVGVVTTLVPRVSFDPSNCIAMICGPEVMMRFSALELTHAGLTEDKIFITMERNMKCAVGFCGHCQFGPAFICKDGPVFRYDQIKPFISTREF